MNEGWNRVIWTEIKDHSEICKCGKVVKATSTLGDFYRLVDWHRIQECPIKGQELQRGQR